MEIATGLYENLTFSDYRKIDAINNSRLSRLDHCPASVFVEDKETPSLVLGRAVHTLVLEGIGAFNREFAVAPICDRRTKDGAENLGKNIITSEDFTQIEAIKKAIYTHPFAAKLLENGISELTIVWKDEEMDLLCKSRVDRKPDGSNGVLVDLKTTRDASLRGFTRSVVEYGYARQAAMYLDGIMKTTGEVFDSFAFIAVEGKPPYRTEVFVLDPRFIEWGYSQYRRLLRLEAECRRRGHWPHYQEATAFNLVKPGYLEINL